MNYLRKENNNFLPGKQAFLFAREAAERILEVDSDSAEAQDLLGFIAMRGENDLAQAAFHYQKALESAPFNEVIIRHVAALLQLLNRVDESVALTEDLLSRDPVNPVLQFNLGIAYYRAKRWNESIAAFETALKLAPDIRLAHGYIGANLLFKGETKAALEEMTKEKSERRRILGTALANYSLGRFEEYEAGLAQFVERWGTEQPHDVARAYAFVGNNDRAFHWLDRAIEMQQPGLSRELVTPFYQSIHSDPRWESFLERIGSSPEQLSAIEFKLPLP